MPEVPPIPTDFSTGSLVKAKTPEAGVPAPDAAEQVRDQALTHGAESADNSLQPVVGLGGSAGSLSAMRSFFSNMPGDSGLAFVVIVHLSPDHESRMAALLQSSTSMPVVQVHDTVKVAANRVYVIPPAPAPFPANA
jgi:two-component system CheB/CheR fusion protein